MTEAEINVHDGHDDEDAALFAQVLAHLHQDNLPSFALSIRQTLDNANNDRQTSSPGGSCSLLPPLNGSYHILIPIQFADGVKWLLKLPATAYPGKWDEQAARDLRTEALTMRLLSRETTIPVPKIYSFDTSTDNELGCAFILMEYIDGVPLQNVWFDRQAPKDQVEKCRLRSLQDVASAMIQLNKFNFEKGGCPIFDKMGLHIEDIGPTRVEDILAELERIGSDDEDETPICYEIGPFSNPHSYLLETLDRCEPPEDKLGQGLHKLLRLFIEWAFSVEASTEVGQQQQHHLGPFVLVHPDFDIQNVLVSPHDCRLLGLIDWEGVETVPRYLGNESYPGWLTRDWDPAVYHYPKETEDEEKKEDIKENSPEELAFYRAKYVEFMRQAKGGYDHSTERLTRDSLMFENLSIAVHNPVSMSHIVSKIFSLATDGITVRFRINNVDDDDDDDDEDDGYENTLLLWDVGIGLVDDNLNVEHLAKLKEGFLRWMSS